MIKTLTLITIFAPLLGSLTAGLGAKKIGKEGAHVVTIVAMLFSFISSAVPLSSYLKNRSEPTYY